MLTQLADHQEMMRAWADDVEWLWLQTRSAADAHPWFEKIRLVKANTPIAPDVMLVEEALDPQVEHEEQLFLEDAEDGELADDNAVDAMVGTVGDELDT